MFVILFAVFYTKVYARIEKDRLSIDQEFQTISKSNLLYIENYVIYIIYRLQ